MTETMRPITIKIFDDGEVKIKDLIYIRDFDQCDHLKLTTITREISVLN